MDDDGVDPVVADMWNEYHYRKQMGISHEDYLREPAPMVEWFGQFASIGGD